MYALIKSIYAECRYLVWPHVCAACKLFLQSNELLCESCMRSVIPLMTIPVTISDSVTMQVYAVASYKGTIKRLILAKDFRDERSAVVLGQLLWDATMLPYASFDVIVPIPVHTRRYAHRGYNQAELMANMLSKLCGKPVILALTCIRSTHIQTNLSLEDRQANLKDAFAILPEAGELLRGKRVLIIDDLMTSGVTLIAAATVINGCNPESIKGAVGGRVA